MDSQGKSSCSSRPLRAASSDTTLSKIKTVLGHNSPQSTTPSTPAAGRSPATLAADDVVVAGDSRCASKVVAEPTTNSTTRKQDGNHASPALDDDSAAKRTMRNTTTSGKFTVSTPEKLSPQLSVSSGGSSGMTQLGNALATEIKAGLRNHVALAGGEVKPYVIGVCGSTCSGKTTLCKILRRELKGLDVAFIPSDCYYRPLSETQLQLAHSQQYDFDHPNALAFDELSRDLDVLKNSNGSTTVELPKYDFAKHARVAKADAQDLEEHTVRPADVIIVEGILIYAAGRELRDQFDLKVFIDCDADIVVLRRLQRDITERGRDLAGVKDQYLRFVKRSWEEFVEPSKRYADVIIPNVRDGKLEGSNAVRMLLHHIKEQLRENHFRRQSSVSSVDS
ncbi:unnamed protein product [Amoebophrya sp. A25]|nr:unnamed protein product [Amoebophrya sp. A25]|eukprot:GSA25T00004244001.1